MRVYSLNAQQGDPRYLQAVQGNYWFWQRGYDVIGFQREQLNAGELDQHLLSESGETIVFASVAIVRDALQRAGRHEPASLDFCSEIKPFIGRHVAEATMAQVRSWEVSDEGRLPIHVKPRDRPKLFGGKVVRGFRDLIALSGIPEEEPVIVQEVVDFVSEWRAYILRGRVLNISHYKGEPLCFPDLATISAAVTTFSQAPIGYAMDWGITSDARTLLVEINDGYALGNYGVRGHHYTALIECRWRQLMGLDDNGVGLDY